MWLRARYKRGVSPLIATVLLISFAVALGSVVLNWGKNLEISKPGDACAGASIKIRNIGNSEVCYSGAGKNAELHFIIDNNGNQNLEGLGIWIVGEKKTKLIDLDDIQIPVGQLIEIKNDRAKYDFDEYGAIKHVQFIPKVMTSSGKDICPRNSVRAEKIGIC